MLKICIFIILMFVFNIFISIKINNYFKERKRKILLKQMYEFYN
jgi:hypothetical protein